MNVGDLMTTEMVTVTPSTSLKVVAKRLAQYGISGMPVCDEESTVLGVISEGDILYKELGRAEHRGGLLAWLVDAPATWDLEKAGARTAGEAMSAPALTAAPSDSAAAAARLMIEHGVNRLPVVTMQGRLVGIVTRADLVRAFTRSDDEICAEIRKDVLEKALWVRPERIDVVVRDGEVELAGELESATDVEVLEKLVEKIPGVVSVRSKVTHWVRDPGG
jgi:CBS domain-containing protein